MVSTLKKVTKDVMRELREEMHVRKTHELFLLFALGSQFDHLIKQALDKLGVFCLVADPASIKAADVARLQPIGIILSGGPVSVYDQPPPFDAEILNLGIPVLGICLGFQLWAQHIGAQVVPAEKREYSTHELTLVKKSKLFAECPVSMPVLESHGDKVIGAKLKVLASTENAEIAAASYRHLYGLQFHPEVTETIYGQQIFHNFCFKICKAKDSFPAQQVAQIKVRQIAKKIKGKNVLLGLSGGSDSATCAYQLKAARELNRGQGKIFGVYIKGIDRPDDEEHVRKYFADQDWLELIFVDATADFLKALKGKSGMHAKRVAMRGVYKSILEEQARKYQCRFICQGTLYTDISESGLGYDSKAVKAQIKLHHNVNLGFSEEFEELLPLADCVKDSGRQIGRELGVPEELLIRHPFPGPGMLVRIEGIITRKKLAIAREADRIFIEELRCWKLYETIWQAGVVVTKSITTCTKGDDANQGYVLAIWAVWSVNGFTARPVRLPWDFIDRVTQRLCNEIRECGAVVYRTSPKPPSTIEWG